MDRNRLGDETSPYLLQHRDNPVHWQAWSPQALEMARQADRPILLSVGYAACHWCHVMAHESFENEAIAAAMNADFVNIKVDREERPDLDTIYQQALSLMGEQGGWPLTMFLTPAGEPFWGGTYFPPEPRWGRPSFPQVLQAMRAAYTQDRDKVAKNVATMREALQKLGSPEPGSGVSQGLLDRIAERLLQEVDAVNGGIGGAPKFPQCGIFELLWRAWKRTDFTPFRDAVVNTLDAMCQGGIYDHLGGGFSRYSTDASWLVPHFEKMLYDNAELIDLLTLVWQETGSPLYRERVAETVGWVLREMTTPGGAFASSLDADSEYEEGKFYVWTEGEIDTLLGASAALFKSHYGVTEGGNWEGKTILTRMHRPERADAATEETLARCRAVLLAARAPRIRPECDDKVLADWNGLMIAALANAGLVFERPDWIDAAEKAFGFIVEQMSAGDGRLFHAWRNGQARHPASLDDYADLARAALVLYEATGERGYVDRARSWVAILDRHYRDAEKGGYFFSADDTESLIARTKSAADAAVPAGNGTLIGVLARLALFTGDESCRHRAEEIVTVFSGELARNFFPLSTLLNNTELLMSPVQIVLAGDRGEPALEALRRAAYAVSVPNRVLEIVSGGAALPPGHPAHGKGRVGGKPAAYLCRGAVCSLPVTDAATLKDVLGKGF